MTKPDPDTIIAEQLRIPSDAVLNMRKAWNDETVMHAVFRLRFEEKIAEVRKQLETVSINDLTAKQSELLTLRRGLEYCTKKEIT